MRNRGNFNAGAVFSFQKTGGYVVQTGGDTDLLTKKLANADYSASQAFEGEVKGELGSPKPRKISQAMTF